MSAAADTTGAGAAGAGAGPLAGLRVVELGDGTAAPYAAKLLADFGADCVKVEQRHGDSARVRGPFPGDRPDPDASGLFEYLNTNKRGWVVDLDDPASCRQLDRLLAVADVFVTNLPAARLGAAGLDPASLRGRHPRLVVTTVTPFGIDGPWADRRGDELVTYAMGGLAYSTPGMPDAADDLEAEPPLHPACFAAETIAGLIAAVGTMGALHGRARTGDGCHVELSQHAAVAAMQHRDVTTHAYLGGQHNRLLNPVTIGRMPNFYLPCKDGYATIAAPMDIHWERLVEAMGSPAWATSGDFVDAAARTANWVDLRRRLVAWTRTLTGDELYALATAQQLPIFPFYTVRKVVGSEQARARGSLVDVEIGGRPARMPAAPVRMQRTPWALRRRAPRLGADAAAIAREWLDGPRPAASASASASVSPRSTDAGGRLPLAGVRVLDLGQYIAMPFCTLWLAWLGAEVLVIESRRNMTSRSAPPFAEGFGRDPDASGYYNLLYAGKKSLVVDMRTEAGRALVRRLADAADVMVDNFSTGVLEKLGLGYDEVRRTNPDIIVASCGAFGRTGPMRHARGLHSAVNLFSGVADVTAYAGSHPRILGGVLPDPLSGTYANFAIQAALHHRDRTGEGQYIDLAMYEAMMTLIPEAVIDLTLNDRDPARIGNRDRLKAPHGIYRCRDADTWVAISVADDAGWDALCRATGRAAWRADARFASAQSRLDNVAELDRELEAWTRTQTPDAAVERLQACGVAAGPVRRCDELLADPLLAARGGIITTDHPVVGVRPQLGLPWRMDSAAVDYRRAPLLGEHTREILSTLLGVDDAEYARLDAAGVFS